jgi:hypothetical protein
LCAAWNRTRSPRRIPAATAAFQRAYAKIRSTKLSRSAGILEPPLLLDGQERHPVHEDPREHADAVAPRRSALRAVDADALHAAGRRVLLRDPAVQPERLELADAGLGEPEHRVGVVGSAPLRDEARGRGGPDEPDRLARHAHPDLELGADRHPLDEGAEDVDEEGVPLVLAVVPDLAAEEARGDAEAQSGAGPSGRSSKTQR